VFQGSGRFWSVWCFGYFRVSGGSGALESPEVFEVSGASALRDSVGYLWLEEFQGFERLRGARGFTYSRVLGRFSCFKGF
jgi:hypothetical protein